MPTKEQILEAAATSPEAKQALEKLFPEYFKNIITIEGGKFFICDSLALSIEEGKFGNKDVEFHLESSFDWVMKPSSLGYQLIPTKK
jgi:hypothetical protein